MYSYRSNKCSVALPKKINLEALCGNLHATVQKKNLATVGNFQKVAVPES